MRVDKLMDALHAHDGKAEVLFSNHDGYHVTYRLETPKEAKGWHVKDEATPVIVLFGDTESTEITDDPYEEPPVTLTMPRDIARQMLNEWACNEIDLVEYEKLVNQL